MFKTFWTYSQMTALARKVRDVFRKGLPALMLAGLMAGAAQAQGTGGFNVRVEDEFGNPGPFNPGDNVLVIVQIQSDQVDFGAGKTETLDYEDVSVTVDLDAALSGWQRTGAVQFGYNFSNCGASPFSSGTSTVLIENVEFLTASFQQFVCEVAIPAQIPASTAASLYTLTTSDLTGVFFDEETPKTPFTFSAESTSFTVEADTTGPVPSFDGPLGPVSNAPFDVSVTFDEPVDGLEISDFVITNGSGVLNTPVGGDTTFFDNYTLTITPSGLGTVTLDLPPAAVQDEADNDSSSATQYSVEVAILNTFSAAISGNPVDPGSTGTLTFTVENNQASALSAGSFTLDLSSALSGLTASPASLTAFCGAGSSLSALSSGGFIVVSDMALDPSSSCTFDVTLNVPVDAAGGNYPIATSNLGYTQNDIAQSLTASHATLQVSGSEGTGGEATFTKTFSADTVAPGDTIDLEFQITAPELSSLDALTFTDDLDAALSGLVAVGLPSSNICGTGSTLSGSSMLTLTGGNLGAAEVCNFSVTLQVPASAPGGANVDNTTSNLTGTEDDGEAVTSFDLMGANDSFSILNTVPVVQVDGPAGPVGQGLPFTVEITFSEDVTGFVAGDMSVANANLGTFTEIDARNYTLELTPFAVGTVTVSVPAGVAQDADTNGNLASNVYSVQSVAAEPELDVTGNDLAISSGDIAASISDGTDFGDVDPVAGGSQRSFTLTNSGTGVLTLTGGTPVTLTGSGAAEFSVTQPSSLSLDPGDSTTFAVTYDPTGNGLDEAVVNIASDDADEDPYTFAIAGTGAPAPEIELSGNGQVIANNDGTPTLTDHTDFGSVELGAGSITRTFTVDNQGSGALTFDTPSIVISGLGAGDFSVTSQLPASLAGSSQTQFDITFTPSSTGPSNAVIAVKSDDADEASYSFAVTGSATGGPEADLFLSGVEVVDGSSPSGPRALGDVLVGSTVNLVFTIENNGTAPLNLSPTPNFTVEPSFPQIEIVEILGAAQYTVTQQPASLVAAGDSTTFTIAFSPDASLDFFATIGFGSDDLDESRYTFEVSGSGVTPEISVEGIDSSLIADGEATVATGPGTDFGQVAIEGGQVTRTFTIRNTGNADLILGSDAVSVSGAGAADFIVTQQPASIVGTGGSTTFDIQFDPTANGVRNAAVSIANNDLDESPYDFALQGEGLDNVAPSVTLSSVATGPIATTFTLDIVFTEVVQNFDVTDLTIVNGSVANFAGSGDTYSVDITPTANGTLTVDVNAGQAQDLAGNDNLAATQFSIEVSTGSIQVETLIIGSVEGEFDYSGDLGNFVMATSGQTASQSFMDLATGTYLISLADEPEFTLDSIACTGASAATDINAGSASVDIAVNTVAECVFTLVADPQIDTTAIATVDLVLPENFAEPGDIASVFSLTNTGGAPLQFIASTSQPWLDIDPTEGEIPANGSLEFQVSLNDQILSLAPGNYTAEIIVENVSSGSGASSSASSSGGSATTAAVAGESVIIPVNITIEAREGTLTIVSTTAPSMAGDATFEYLSTIPGVMNTSITTSSGTGQLGPVTVTSGEYSLQQSALEGWRLNALSCTGDLDGGTTTDLSSGSVTLDLDANEAIVCTFANVRDEDYVRQITVSAIRDFVAQRADRILSNSPRVGQRLRGGRDGTTPTRFSADFTEGRIASAFSTSLSDIRARAQADDPFAHETGPAYAGINLSNANQAGVIDVWIQGTWSESEDDRAGLNSENSFGMVFIGADMLLNEDILIGGLVQFDQMETTTGPLSSRIDGDGWMAGPYMAARIGEQLYFDARFAWGKSDNTINPLGLYEDTFDTSRWLIETNLVGDIYKNGWRISPEAGLSYFAEETDGYTDSLGITIPGQEVTLGRLHAGPEIAWRHDRGDGAFVEPYIRLSAIYNYDEAEVLNASGSLQGLGTFRADARVGLTAQFRNGGQLSGEVSFDGLGESDFEATAARLVLRVPLSLD